MDPATAETLLDALDARRGIVAVVGAGGKKTTLHRLIEAHRVLGTRRLALTTTVKMALTPSSLNLTPIIDTPAQVKRAVQSTLGVESHLFYAALSTNRKRHAGMPPNLIGELHHEGAFDVTFVKADGARMRLIKAPNEREPVLPEAVTTVLPVVSARALGKPISFRFSHRPDELQAVIGCEDDRPLTARDLACLLTSAKGALHKVGQASVVPIINMVDSAELLDQARDAARIALRSTDRFDRIVLASMLQASPLVEIVSGACA